MSGIKATTTVEPCGSCTSEYEKMETLFDRLFPICRSIAGPGLRQTLQVLEEYVPLSWMHFKSGERVFDWVIPQEWHIREAWLKGPDGRIIADFQKNNLHVINFSAPVNVRLSLSELKPHLYTVPHLPDAVPYVTSYYKRRWGFCISHKEYEKLVEGEYHAYIDANFVDGELNIAEAVLPGTSEKEVLVSTNVCHPSMANNELSGPIAAVFLYHRLKCWSTRRFTYRFVFLPETIGSIAYLNRMGERFKRTLHAGLVLTCLGGKGPEGRELPLSYKTSRRETGPLDLMVRHLVHVGALDAVIRPFTPISGSDERQYCSPGFNLPVGQMARAVYATYPEYHTSLDTKEFMTISALQKSVNELERLFYALELDGYYINTKPFGEVKLDRYGLYPDMNTPSNRHHSTNDKVDGRVQLERILTVLNYADGRHSLREIAEKCGCTLLELEDVVKGLLSKNLLTGPCDERIYR